MKLFYITLIAFVFVVTSALAISKGPNIEKVVLKTKNQQSLPPKLSPLPVLGAQTSTFPIISAEGALAVDLASGVSLYEKNPDARLLPASTTKIVTALVAMQAYSPEDVIAIKNIRVEGQKMGLVEGEQITVNNLLYGLLVFSANDAAEALAANYPGGREAFIIAMNTKAKELNLENTLFTNPAGLDGGGIHTTPRDLIRVATNAMGNPYFARIVATKQIVVESTDGRVVHNLKNVNELLGNVSGVYGVKTGWTENARENLVTYIKRDDKEVMIALLGSQDRFGETSQLIDWIFNNYSWVEVTSETTGVYSAAAP